jgi:hypothetical protein
MRWPGAGLSLCVTSLWRVTGDIGGVPGPATVAHARPMTPALTAPEPGNMTVPPLFGWQVLGTALVLLVVLAIIVFLYLMTGRAPSGRAEWQAFLEGRSSRVDPAGDLAEVRVAAPSEHPTTSLVSGTPPR